MVYKSIQRSNGGIDMIVKHPDGGSCNTDGMTSDCYGCVYYGCGLIEECNKRRNNYDTRNY